VITAEAFDGDNQLLGTDKIYLEFTDLGPAANHDQILAELEQEPKNSQEKAIPSPSTEAGDTEVTTPQSITVPKGKISFDGVGKFGERLNIHTSAKLIETAIINELSYVTLSVDKENPQLEVAPELQNAGIKELLAVGESDFSGSPVNRVFNINKGADTFNGIIVGPGEEFSFNDILGPVNGATGYRQELVILGEQTIPDYGGGLCQVSTTAFRAAMLSGVEITERWAHAYAVSYYQPWGSDATIYIGGKNFRFKNDTTGALLIQTHIEDDKLYFHFYGSPDDRQVALYGPYVGRFRGAPAARTKYVDNLAPGARKVVSGSHNGFDATWYRLVRDDGESKLKEIFSRFQARGVIVLVGRSAESAPAAEGGSGEAEAVGG
jgi:vancomycin resistance protein YoaR